MPDVHIEEEKETDKIRVQFKEDAKKEINITYQTIQDLSRVENNRAELQKLSDSFFLDLINYLNEKKKILNAPADGDLFSSTEKENTRIQMDNIINLLDKLYDKRERKLINMALDTARVGKSLIDTSIMLKEEKKLFEDVTKVLESYRKDILLNIKDGKHPEVTTTPKNGVPVEGTTKNVETTKRDTVLVRFLSAVPKFVGKDLEIIGPFEEEDVANLPQDIADVLIEKERAEIIDDNI